MNIEDHDELTNFFSSYFHEDWRCEAETTEQIVQIYLRTALPAEVARLRAAITAYAENEPDNEALEEKLLSELRCYYLPSADGLMAKDWLMGVADLLLVTHNLE